MRIPSWYLVLVAAWSVLVAPAGVLAIGFGGGSLALPDLGLAHAQDLIVWLLAWALLTWPILMAPFLIRRPRTCGARPVPRPLSRWSGFTIREPWKPTKLTTFPSERGKFVSFRGRGGGGA